MLEPAARMTLATFNNGNYHSCKSNLGEKYFLYPPVTYIGRTCSRCRLFLINCSWRLFFIINYFKKNSTLRAAEAPPRSGGTTSNSCLQKRHDTIFPSVVIHILPKSLQKC